MPNARLFHADLLTEHRKSTIMSIGVGSKRRPCSAEPRERRFLFIKIELRSVANKAGSITENLVETLYYTSRKTSKD